MSAPTHGGVVGGLILSRPICIMPTSLLIRKCEVCGVCVIDLDAPEASCHCPLSGKGNSKTFTRPSLAVFVMAHKKTYKVVLQQLFKGSTDGREWCVL